MSSTRIKKEKEKNRDNEIFGDHKNNHPLYDIGILYYYTIELS